MNRFATAARRKLRDCSPTSRSTAQLLEQIELTERTPDVHRSGHLGTAEGDTAPYPKTYDMQAMTPEMRTWAQNRYGCLHVSTADQSVGIDEVMTVVSGGPLT